MKEYKHFREKKEEYMAFLIAEIEKSLPLTEEIIINDSYEDEWFKITEIFKKNGVLHTTEKFCDEIYEGHLTGYSTDILEQICVSLLC